jgi:signal peptidase II
MQQEIKKRKYFLCLLLFVLGFAVLDQWAKNTAVSRISPGETIEVFGPLSLTLVYNPSFAFGISALPESAIIPFVVVSLALFLLLLYFLPRNYWTLISGALVLSGGVSNLFDRLTQGSVVDYILLSYWPAFNLADMSITAGFLLFILYLLFFSPREIFSKERNRKN